MADGPATAEVVVVVCAWALERVAVSGVAAQIVAADVEQVALVGTGFLGFFAVLLQCLDGLICRVRCTRFLADTVVALRSCKVASVKRVVLRCNERKECHPGS